MKNIVMNGAMAIVGVLVAPVVGIGLGEGVITLPMAILWMAATGLNAYAAVRAYELR